MVPNTDSIARAGTGMAMRSEGRYVVRWSRPADSPYSISAS